MSQQAHEPRDFDFDFEDMPEPLLDTSPERPEFPSMVQAVIGGRTFVGYVSRDAYGQEWLISPHELCIAGGLITKVLPLDSFIVFQNEYMPYPDADILTKSFPNYKLNMALMGDVQIPVPCMEH